MIKLQKLCIKWLNENYSLMEPFETEKHPDYIFYMKDGKCILQYNKKSRYVYVNYNEIWSFFESFFSMEYEQIQGVTKVWVEEQYKMGVTTTCSRQSKRYFKVEEQYKMGVTTTIVPKRLISQQVEEQYKMGVTTTAIANQKGGVGVEEQYKMGVTTTEQ